MCRIIPGDLDSLENSQLFLRQSSGLFDSFLWCSGVTLVLQECYSNGSVYSSGLLTNVRPELDLDLTVKMSASFLCCGSTILSLVVSRCFGRQHDTKQILFLF